MRCIVGGSTWRHWSVCLFYFTLTHSNSVQFFLKDHNVQFVLWSFISGLVPSGSLLPLLQWGVRINFVLAVVGGIHEVLFYLWITSFSFSINLCAIN